MTAQRQTGLRVLLAGATGLVGGHCLTQLLTDDDIGHVTVLTRRALERTHPKLATHIVNFDHLGDHAEAINADIALCCLGTTQRAAGSSLPSSQSRGSAGSRQRHITPDPLGPSGLPACASWRDREQTGACVDVREGHVLPPSDSWRRHALSHRPRLPVADSESHPS